MISEYKLHLCTLKKCKIFEELDLYLVEKFCIIYLANLFYFCLHGTQVEVETTERNWSAQCQYNVTGWVSMWAYDMLSQ